MLTHLRIQNLILINQAEISFGNGLNILTGETGSGKSAILWAIKFIAGERADIQKIKTNSDLAIIEASLFPYSLPDDIASPPLGEPLLIRREIHRSGKSRCFAEDQQISLSVLRQIIGSSIELVDQVSSRSLCIHEEQRRMLDSFAGLIDEAKKLSESFAKEQAQSKKLDELLHAQENRSRDLAWTQEDLAFIEQINWVPEEEEQMARDHRVLSHSQELLEKVSQILDSLENQSLKQASHLLENCLRFDPSLSPLFDSLKTTLLEIEEMQQKLGTYLDRLDVDPKRLASVEDRISAIEQLKRRFGKTVEEVNAKKKDLLARIERLSHLDEEAAALKKSLQSTKEDNLARSQFLSDQRKKAATGFSERILKELKTLNLLHARFEIAIHSKPLCSNGSDHIRFLFSSNPGQPLIPLEECASGGELSRLLLAIKTVLAEKEQSACLVFDEIDSNVGGQTAAVLGEKLKAISERKQVICVTHFIQVAKCALHHFAVVKKEQKEGAVTKIAKLEESEREREYQRMLGSY